MPSLINEVHRLTQTTIENLRALPPEISDDPAATVLNLVMDFHRDVSTHVEGIPDGNGLIQQFRIVNTKFRDSIRGSAPSFRPYKSKYEKDKKCIMPEIRFLSEEDEGAPSQSQPYPKWILYEEDVSRMSQE